MTPKPNEPSAQAMEEARKLEEMARAMQKTCIEQVGSAPHLAWFLDYLDAAEERGRALEREECAQVADAHLERYADRVLDDASVRAAFGNHRMAARDIALEIRARAQGERP